MSQSMNMIFEVADLAVASPATVSRCGMVYVEPGQLGWRPLRDSWERTLPEALGADMRKRLHLLFEWLVDPCTAFLRYVAGRRQVAALPELTRQKGSLASYQVLVYISGSTTTVCQLARSAPHVKVSSRLHYHS